jgi:hypothetical protein
MKNNKDTYGGTMVCDSLRYHDMVHELQIVAKVYDCSFNHEIISQHYRRVTLRMEYSGDEKNIEKVEESVNELKTKWSKEYLRRYFKQYKVKSAEQKMSNNEFDISVNVNKFSNFINLAKAIAQEVNTPISFSQKSNGFFKGKEVKIEAYGSPQQVKSFKALMNSFISITPNNKRKHN